MKISHFLPQKAAILIIILIGVQTITSCSGDGGDEGGGGLSSPSGGGGTSSSSGGGSVDKCSIELPPVASPCIDGEVVIGTQIWSKCNLNVEPSTGKSACYCNKPENCEKYGRLYDWATAMALDASCNSTSCDSLISYQHQGLCPAGWHIPRDDEWGRMSEYALDDKGSIGSNSLIYHNVGGYFKATSGWSWDDSKDKDGNGTDVYGFSALPGGFGAIIPYIFLGAGEQGMWWSTKESVGEGITGSDGTWKYGGMSGLYLGNLFMTGGSQHKEAGGNSVRCIKNVVADCAGFVEGTEREHYGRSKPQFCDSRDGKKYVYATIGEQTWMAENLDYGNVDGHSIMGYSRCYKGKFANCDKYGRLYDLETARKICPSGWHLPSDAEWTTLENFVGSSTAGTKLKAASGWNDYEGKSGNGTDVYGFSALPGGYNYHNNSSEFYDIGSKGFWWSDDREDLVYIRGISYNGAGVTRESSRRVYSVRCVKD